MAKLTRDELLVLLIEECSEVIQAATKAIRFGFDVDNGVGYGNNKLVLSREAGDLLAVIDALPLDRANVEAMRATKIGRAEAWKDKFAAISKFHEVRGAADGPESSGVRNTEARDG